MTFVLFGQWRSGNSLSRSVHTKNVRELLALQAVFHLQGKQEGFQGAPVVVSGGLPPLPLDLGPARGVGVPLGSRLVAPASPSPSGAGEVGAARSQQTPTSRASASVVSPQSLPHVQRREDSRETSESCPRVLSSRGSRSSDRGARKDRKARSRTSSSRGRRRRSRSLSSSSSLSRGRERRRRSSSRSLSSRTRSRRDRSRSFDRSRSSDRYRSRSDRSRRERSRSVDRYRPRRQRTRSPAHRGDRSDRSRSHALPNRSRDRERSCGRLPGSPARSRVEEPGRLARRETQEGVEAVASQPPAVSEAAVAVTPVAGGAALTALPSAVQDLARFFLSLSGSSSLGAIGGIAGVTASAAGSGVLCARRLTLVVRSLLVLRLWRLLELAFRLLLPLLFLACLVNSSEGWNPAPAGVAVDRPVTGPTGELRREPGGGLLLLDLLLVVGGGTIALLRIRLMKTELMPLLPDLDMRMEVRLVVPALLGRMIGRLVLGRLDHMPGMTGTGQVLVVDPLLLRVWRMTTGLVPFESVDFDRDDSSRSVLGLIRNFHGLEEPAGVPSARCKTSLASAYGLMSEVSPAFTLPASPLVRSLLDDTNLALSKFLEDQTVHGFLPVPGRRHRRYYSTSSSSFPGPYTVPPGVTSITLEKVSEAKKRSVALSASQVSLMEAMLSGVCEVSSWLDWWLSTCGGFRDHLPVEVRADFERLMISGSRALEFLAS